ncbi:hypothetical protein CN488_25300 [Bacillus anthracis]|nr:hypothetical protein CN488_25300 [Bacillus anthracis]PEY20069.1 hypothetical protein CN340_25285 [Bacillus anthracis]PGR18257.1 hypothetical protein COC50_24670 [Bacillus anthracis]
MRPFKRMRTIYLITVPIIALLSLFFPQSVGDRILTFFFILVFGGLAIGFSYLLDFIKKQKIKGNDNEAFISGNSSKAQRYRFVKFEKMDKE